MHLRKSKVLSKIRAGKAAYSLKLNLADPRVAEIAARRLVAEAARKSGKTAGTTVGIGTRRELEAEGFNFVSLGADVIALNRYFNNITSQLKD